MSFYACGVGFLILRAREEPTAGPHQARGSSAWGPPCVLRLYGQFPGMTPSSVPLSSHPHTHPAAFVTRPAGGGILSSRKFPELRSLGQFPLLLPFAVGTSPFPFISSVTRSSHSLLPSWSLRVSPTSWLHCAFLKYLLCSRLSEWFAYVNPIIFTTVREIVAVNRPHFVGGETESHLGHKICSRSHS